MNNPRKSISGDTIATILDWFYLYKDVSLLAKSIYACTENTLDEYKYIRSIHKEYFAVCGQYAPLDTKLSLAKRILHKKTKKIIDPKLPF